MILNAPPRVIEETIKSDMQVQLEALARNTTPQAIDRIAKDAAKVLIDRLDIPDQIIPPRFRGTFYVVGRIDGTINGVQMNLDDWIWYAGPSGVWSSQYVYQWTSTGWQLRPRPSQNVTYGWLYVDAMSSITEGAPLGMFSDVFCKALVAEVAFIANLFAQTIILRSPNGRIQSENYQVGKLGFTLEPDGSVEFNVGKFRGHIEAASGTFHGRIEGQEGYIKGTLCAGGRWDINGNSVNTNAPGLFVPGVGSAGGMFAKATTMLIEQALAIGDYNRDGYLELNNTTIRHNFSTHAETQSWISGTYTLSQLNTAIANKLSNAQPSGYRIPINGSVSIYHEGTESSSDYTVVYILSSMEYRSAGYYRLHGLAIDGHGNMSASAATLDCTGSDQVTANFVIL